ncbi:MAG TPA: VOC family protein, partial [Kofleriaceae bacterium]|nr:VOC family protein [Kofleriaceae bacterium]
QQALGLATGRRLGNDMVEMLGAALPIDLLRKPAGSPASDAAFTALRGYARHWTPLHLDVVVDQLEPAIDRARRAGAVLDRAIQEAKWGRMAQMADPFGHGFCLVQFLGRGYDELVSP